MEEYLMNLYELKDRLDDNNSTIDLVCSFYNMSDKHKDMLVNAVIDAHKTKEQINKIEFLMAQNGDND